MFATMAGIILRSPLLCTPQSMRTCALPPSVGNVSRKQSPKPTRYMRIRALPPDDVEDVGVTFGLRGTGGVALRFFTLFDFAFFSVFAVLDFLEAILSEPPMYGGKVQRFGGIRFIQGNSRHFGLLVEIIALARNAFAIAYRLVNDVTHFAAVIKNHCRPAAE